MIVKDIIHFHYIYGLYGQVLVPVPMKFTNLVDSSLLKSSICLVCLIYVQLEVEKKILNEIMHFHFMTYSQALAQEPLSGVQEMYNFGRLFLSL